MTRECHVRFCERLGVRLPRPTHPPEGLLYIKSPDGDPALPIRAIWSQRPSRASYKSFCPACGRSGRTTASRSCGPKTI